MTQRAHGSGSLVERPKGSGTWHLRVRVGIDPVTGKERRRSWTIKAKTRAAADREARAIIASIEAQPATGTKAPLSALLEEWYAHSEARGRSPHTLEANRRLIDNIINPALGAVPLDELTGRQIDAFYNAHMARGVSASTVRRYHAVLSAALNQSVKWGYLPASPIAQASPPPVKKKPLRVPTTAEVGQVISAMQARDDAYGMAAYLAVVTGARRGEVCALRWSDLRGDELHVQASAYTVGGKVGVKSTKSGRDRVVVLGEPARAVLEVWRRRCEALAAEAEVELLDSSFILSKWPDGSRFLNPDSLTATFSVVAREVGLPHVHFHSLRHFAATELLAAGVSPQDAATVLGHANPTMTLNVYAHATVERQRAAGAVLARALEAP